MCVTVPFSLTNCRENRLRQLRAIRSGLKSPIREGGPAAGTNAPTRILFTPLLTYAFMIGVDKCDFPGAVSRRVRNRDTAYA